MAQEREAGEQSPSGSLTFDEPQQTGQEETTAEETATETGDKPAETPPGDQPATTTSPAPAAEDPFAALHPKVRERLESLSQLAELVPTLQNSVKTAEGRVAAMQREMDVAKQAAKAAPAQAAPTTAQIAAASGDVKKWESLKSDFPEWADATEQFVNAKLAGLTPQQASGMAPEEVQQLVKDAEAKARAQALAAVEEAKVELKYEDWAQRVNSPEFKAWFAAQDANTQALAKSPRGRDAITLIDRFEARNAGAADTGAPSEVQQARSKKLAAAVTTPHGQQATPPSKTVEDMSASELWEYERKRAAKRGAERGLSY
jgi:hypothetical protein